MTAVMLLTGMTLWGQTNYSTTYTSNVTLSTEGGTSATTCKVIIDGTPYDGIKAGTSNIAGAWKVTVPAGTEYLHLHVAAWKNDNVTLTVTPSNLVDDIVLTSNNGISSNSPFTFVGDPSTDDYYKVIVLGNLSEDTDLTFTATTGKRFVVFGVNSDNGNPSTPIVATPTFSPAGGTYFEAQSVSIACATEGATIRYTLDGTDPTENSTAYTNPLSIESTTTVKAKAWKDGYEASAVASATYTIEEGIAFNRVSNHAVVAGSTYLIVDLHSGRALTSANGTTGSPTAVPVYFNADSTQVTTGNAQLQWTFETADGGYIIHPTENESEWLYCIAENTGARVGTGEANIWTINVTDDTKPNYHGFLNNAQERYLGVYNNQDWRTYITINNNIQDTQIELFVMGDAPQPTPTLAVTPTSLGGLDYAYGEGPSDAQVCTVSGTLLNESVTVTAPESFEIGISADGSFGGSLVLEPVSGTLSATAVHVRLAAGLDPGSYSGILTVACGDLSQTVALSGSVGEMPVVATPTFSVEEGTYLTPQTVSITCATEGATIRYTLDGTDPTENSTAYTEPLSISETTTVKAKAWKDGYEASAVASATYTINIPDPVLTVAPTALEGFTYTYGSGPSEGQTITVSGTYLTENVTVTASEDFEIGLSDGNYSGTLTLVPESGTLSATTINVRMVEGLSVGDYSGNVTVTCGNLSQTVTLSGNVTALPVAATPTFSPAGGTYTEAQTVSITCATEGATIHYTIDGTDPTENSDVYGTPLDISETTTVKAKAWKNGYEASAIASATYTINIPDPVLTVAPTTLEWFTYTYGSGPSEGQTATVSGTYLTENVTVTAPENFEISLSDGNYSGTLTLVPESGTLSATTINVRMVEGLSVGDYSGDVTVTCGNLSQTVALGGSVSALPVAATPTFSPEGGTYTEAQTVSITCATEGATIRYTIDGTDPTENSTAYTDPLSISETTTVKAKAWKNGYEASAVASATYTIEIPVPVEDYVRITNVGNLVAGNKVIIAARYDDTVNHYMAMPNNATGKPSGIPFVSDTNDGIETIPSEIANNENSYYWTVNVTANGYTFTNANSELIGYSSSTDFTQGGENTEWTISPETSPSNALVPDYSGFMISNGNISTRSFAMNSSHKFGAYANSNMTNNNAGTYNFVLDIFMQGDQGTPIAATPTFSPAGGTYTEAQTVSITCATEGATIRYTIDGTDPTENSTAYTDPLSIESTTTVKAKAWKEGYEASAIASATYTINIPDPVLTVAPTTLEGFTYTYGSGPSEGQTVTVSGTYLTENVTVTAPESFEIGLSDGNYSGMLTLVPESGTLSATTINVRMVEGLSVGDYSGDVTVTCGNLSQTVALSGNVTALPVAATPTFSPAGGTYIEAQTVSIACATEGATIRYTLDGTDPTENSTAYTEPLSIESTTTVKAKAWKDGYEASGIASATYTIPTLITIAEAKTLDVNQYALVQGVVTLIDGRSIYVQDATGGICLYLNSNTVPSELALGDMVRAYGKRANFNGLFELSGINGGNANEFSIVSTGNELPLAVKTIAEILEGGANALQCTRVKIEGATIGTINTGGNTPLTQNGSTVNIYKVPTLSGIDEGDIVDVTGVVGYYNVTQMRVALASDVVLVSQPDPVLTVAPTALEGFTYTYGSGPSEGQTVTVSGTYLTENVTVTAPEDFEIGLSADGGFFGNLELTPTDGTLAATQVFVRLAAGLEVGDYSGNVTVTCGNLSQTVALSGSVTALPVAATPTFSPDEGTYIEAQTVSIACATEGATIRYTLDGTDPTENSTAYTEPLSIESTTTVKAKAWKDGYEASAVASATYTITEPPQATDYTLITDNSGLVAGEKYIVVGMKNDAYKALGKQKNNNRDAVEVVPVDYVISLTPASATDNDAVFELTLGQDSIGYWTLYDAVNQGYLYAASSSSNYLRTQETNDANGQWTIAIANDGVATIIAQGSNTRNQLRYNSSSSLFSCYLSGQENVYLYKSGDAPQPTPTLAVTPTSLGGLDYAYGEGPSDAQACTVSGALLNENVTVTAPESFEIGISADGSFGGSLVLEPVSGTLSATAVHVRLAAGLDPGSYSGILTVACGDLSQTVALSGSVGEMPVVATPTFSVEEGTYLTPQTVSIACATEGATIHYTTDGTDPTENSMVYSEPIEVTATMTLKAMATAENHSNSGIASATYTIYEPANISDIRNLPNNTYACMEGTVILIDGRNVYVQDGTAGIDLYLNNNTVPAELALGDVVRAYGKKTVYNGLIELTGINGNNPNEFSIISNGNTLPLEVRTIAEINADFNDDNLLQSTRVKIENAIIGAINYNGITVISQDRAELNIYHLPYVEGLIEGDIVTVIGVIGCYNAPQLLVASADDVEFIHSPSLNATPISLSGLDYDYETGGPSEIDYFLLSGEHLIDDVKVYPSEHFEVSTYGDDLFHPENPAIVYTTTGNFFDIKIYVRLMAGLEPGTYTEQLSVVSEGAQTIYVTVTGTVYGDGPTPPPASGDYVRISSLSELAVGSQVVFAARFDENATSYYAMSNQSSGKPTGVLFTSTTSGSDEILPTSIVDEESSFYWTVGMTANGYTFTNADGELIGYTSSTNFATGGDNTEWGIELGTAGDEAMVPGYTGFVITNVNNETRHFALNSNHNFGPYHTNNINSSGYNFYLDIFVKGEGGGTPVVATPTFTPEGGTYYEPQTVSITCATEGATIHYTLDGTNPTEASPVYGAPILINATTTVKAFAVKDDYDDSAIATATYTIQTGVATIFNQDWEEDWHGWTERCVVGDSLWRIASYQGNHYAYANGYNHDATVDWLISPAFDLGDYSDVVLTFRTARNYNGPDIEVYFSNDYDGQDPTEATWQELDCALSTGSWTWTESGEISLDGFSGTNCYIGFKYTSTDNEAAGWEVDDIMLIGQTSSPVVTVSPLTLSGFSYLVNNGPSAEQSFTVSGMNLSGDLILTEAAYFEISTASGSDFNAQSTITLTPTNGTVEETTVYVRMIAGLSVGDYEDDIEITSTGANDVEVTCIGSVTEQPVPGGDYIRIAGIGELMDGNRVILAARYNETTNAYLALSNTLTSGKLTTTEFTSTMNGADETIPANIMADEDDYYWTLNVTSEGYTFTNANGDVIGYGSSGTNFVMGGEKTHWNIDTGTSEDGALVPNYFGFNIINAVTNNRAFALRVTETESVVKVYATSNMNSGEYNFFLDIFMQGEGGTPTVAAPTFTPEGGTYYETQDVTLNCATEGATIYYSLDSETGPWEEYEEAITVDESMTIWAYAVKDDYNDSPVVSAAYVIQDDITVIFNQDWEEDWHGWTERCVVGDSLWRIASYQGNHYAYANGYNHDATVDWLISPAFDLDSYSDVVLTFVTAKNYNGPDIEVYFSNDYDGQDPTAATWQELECELSTGSWTWTESGEISLDGFSGSNCYIGFKYTSTDDEAAGWEVDDIMLVSGSGSSSNLTATPNSISGLDYLEGQGPSASQSYTLTGANLEGSGSVMVTVDEGFEISLDDMDYGMELEIAYANGQLVDQPVTIYVRLTEGLEIGAYEGTVTHIGGGASAVVSLSGTVHSEDEPMMEAFMPLYIQGNNGSNNNRVPVATGAYFVNLEPNTTYRYTNQFVDDNDGPETAGAGNVIYANPDGFYRSTSPSLSTEGGYGEFTTDGYGEAFVWFVNEPTANARFTPGNHVYLRIRINDGHDGTTVANIFTTDDYATVLNFGTGNDETQGTAFYAKSDEAPMNFAMMFATDDDWRPIYSTCIETVGVDYGSINQYANFYKEEVAGKDGWFGGILPNANDDGVNLIWILDMESYIVHEYYSENGQWYPEANTVNPTNGLDEPIFIDLTYDGVEEAFNANVKVWSAYHELVVENGDNENYAMTVYNLLGQPLMYEQINAGSTRHIGHHLPNGLYVVSLQNNKHSVSVKVFVR